MSRFYLVRLTPPNTPATPKTGMQPLTVTIAESAHEWTTHPSGVYDPAYHTIQFDFLVVESATKPGAMVLTIEGVGMHDLMQAANFSPIMTGTNLFQSWRLELYGGMAGDGLPLSTAAAGQPAPGLLAVGEVQEAFGNWVGTDMSLSFLVVPEGIQVAPLLFWWTAGQPIAEAIKAMLSQAFPGIPQKIQVSPNIVGPAHGVTETHETLHGMAHFLKEQTKGTNYGQAANYPGISLYIQNGTLIATDLTQTDQMTIIELSEESFIGQPVWTGKDTMSMNLVMRPDIQVGNYVKMPSEFKQLPGFVNTPAQPTNYDYNFKLLFSGKFKVTAVRHIGESRGQSGEDWMTVVEAVAEPVHG